MRYGIMARLKGMKRFAPLDYGNGVTVTNVIYQTLWDDRKHVEELVDNLNKDNPNYEFKLIDRGLG